MRIPFTPVVYEHAARFVGRTPWEVSRDAELMFEGHRRAYLEYHQQVIAVGIDRVLGIAGGRPNCVIGTGAMPYETPHENIRLIREYVAQ